MHIGPSFFYNRCFSLPLSPSPSPSLTVFLIHKCSIKSTKTIARGKKSLINIDQLRSPTLRHVLFRMKSFRFFRK